MQQELQLLEEHSNLHRLPRMVHDGRDVIVNGKRMLNLSSNDYLGLASDRALREEFLRTLTPDTFLPTSSSSRLLTGNFTVYEELEAELAHLFGTEAALVFNSGYHANTGILPAVSDAQTLILADKLVHASLIDGIRLSAAKCIRYRHNDLAQLERLQQLGQLQQTQKLKPTNYDYTAFSNVKNAILYLDPPYQNTKNDYKFELDYQLFYDWCVEMSKRNIVIISGYNIPDPRFKVVWEFKTARGTYAGGVNKRYEKLYMVSEGR